MFRKIIFNFLIFLSLTTWAYGANIDVSAEVSANKISLKDAAQLTITISGSKDDVAPIDLPKIDGFDARYLGPSTSISIVNGQYSSKRSFIYNLFPSKTGHIQIPAINVSVNGNAYTTNPIDIEVVDGPVESGAGDGQAPSAGIETLKTKIFLSLSTAKTEVYMGEKVPLDIKLYINQLPVRNIQFPKFDKSGFTMEEIPQPQQITEVLNGIKYDVIHFHTYLYPTRSGLISIGPAQIEGNLLYKTKERQNSFGNSLFNDDFFNGFFDNYQARPLMVSADAMNLKVLDLPESGKPVGFNGAVGQLDFKATISPDKVKVGDPITLRMSITGSANFKSIQMPVFDDGLFKTYEPQIKDDVNAKTLEQVIIPTSDQVKEAPALTFNYFDPVLGQYKTVTQGPFLLTVAAPSPSEEFKAIGFNNLPQAGSVKVEQVDYIQKYVKDPIKGILALFKNLHFWLAIILVGMVWAAWVVWIKFRDRLSKDEVFARRLKAMAHAKQGIKQAQLHLKENRAQDFYNTLFKALNNYLADKLQKSAGGLSFEIIQPLLQQKQVSLQDIAIIKSIFDACDMIRFAATNPNPNQMSQDLAKLEGIISVLEKKI